MSLQKLEKVGRVEEENQLLACAENHGVLVFLEVLLAKSKTPMM